LFAFRLPRETCRRVLLSAEILTRVLSFTPSAVPHFRFPTPGRFRRLVVFFPVLLGTCPVALLCEITNNEA
jgi:hypothetical protein